MNEVRHSIQAQIQKMLAASDDPRRRFREQATNFPWISPVFAVAFAIGKLSRVVKLQNGMIRLAEMAAADMAEELRESAHYLLRAAALLDNAEVGDAAAE